MDKEWTFSDMNRAVLLKQAVDGKITIKELSEELKVSERHAWRLKSKFKLRGSGSVPHGNKGRASQNRLVSKKREKLIQVFKQWGEESEGINCSHLRDILERDHSISISRQTCWRELRANGLIMPTRKVQKHRTRRERRSQEGDILFLDGSPHPWLGQNYRPFTLILCIDDATSKALGAIFVPEENRDSCFEVAYRVMIKYGLPRSFYLDRASQFITTRGEGLHFKQTPGPTHWQNAMHCLGIKLIFASSPQARGRGERANGTFQRRLAAEMQFKKIKDLGAANRFLNEVFIPEYNQRFSKNPTSESSAWRPVPEGMDLRTILAARYGRRVLNDNTVRHDGVRYQLLPSKKSRTFARDKVEVQKWFDGTYHVIHPDHGDLRYVAERDFDGHRRQLHPDIIAATAP